jgi:hypothetical protein
MSTQKSPTNKILDERSQKKMNTNSIYIKFEKNDKTYSDKSQGSGYFRRSL